MNDDPGARRAPTLATLIFVQMLPATLLTPAVRPLFAALHGGAQATMHAFLSLGMLGAALSAPLVGALADRTGRRAGLLRALAGADAVLLALLPLPWPTAVVLSLRALEGGAHVGAATLLIAAMAERGSRAGHHMGLAGAAIMAAVALGSTLGGALLVVDLRAPFAAAALLAAAAAHYGPRHLGPGRRRAAAARIDLTAARALAAPLAAAFTARFAIGCLVVTFALLAHTAHDLGDATIGVLFSTMTVPFALATYPMARIGARRSPALLLAAGVLVWGAALLGLGWAPTWALPPLMAIGGVASAAIFAPILGYAAAAPGGRATAMALINAAGCAGMLLGPAAAGVTIALLRRSGAGDDAYRGPFVVAAAAAALWLVAALPWVVRAARAELAARLDEERPAPA